MSALQPRPTPIRGLFESHLTVHNLRRSVEFYTEVVGLALALEVPERGAAFLWIGGRGKSMLGLWEIGSSPLSLGLHPAFSVDLAHVLGAPERLRAQGITPLWFGEGDTPILSGGAIWPSSILRAAGEVAGALRES
jgi:lactoylglutathione lyase